MHGEGKPGRAALTIRRNSERLSNEDQDDTGERLMIPSDEKLTRNHTELWDKGNDMPRNDGDQYDHPRGVIIAKPQYQIGLRRQTEVL